eukprot:gene14601-5680_t
MSNNNGIPDKPEAVSHFSLADNGGRLVLLDLQGVGHKLCDPEIGTSSRLQNGQDEQLLCAGNLRDPVFENCFIHHVCNTYCRQLS